MSSAEMPASKGNKRHATPQSLNAAVKGICDIMRRSNCAGALQYVPELTWILFLRILDEREAHEAEAAEAVGAEFVPTLGAPYRWQDWAAPGGAKRKALEDGKLGDLFNFLNGELLPHLRKLRDQPGATSRQRVVSELMSGVERTRIDTERNFRDVLDKVDEIRAEAVDTTHVFTLSQVYEGLLLKMGERGNDGGQFFTPREVIRAMIRVIDPQIGETIYDPGCGTGGFLAQSFEHMAGPNNERIQTGEQLETLRQRTFYGREKDNAVYPIALANLVLHGIDEPHIWHGNTLTGQETYGGLFESSPALFDVVMSNPPFGGKEGAGAQTRFAYRTGATQVLFLQHILNSMAPTGRCGLVIDEGVLFRTNERAFVDTKRKLLNECDLWCIVSLPGGVFSAAGAGVKTNLLFFTRGKSTERIWYFDLSDQKTGKKTPFTLEKFADFFRLLPSRGDSERSWTVDIAARRQQAKVDADAIRAQAAKPAAELARLEDELKAAKKAKRSEPELAALKERAGVLAREVNELNGKAQAVEDAAFDLKAVNPNAKSMADTRTPGELLEFIASKGKEVEAALAQLREAAGNSSPNATA